MAVPRSNSAITTLRGFLGTSTGGAVDGFEADGAWVGSLPWNDAELDGTAPHDRAPIDHAPPGGDAWLWNHDGPDLPSLRNHAAYRLSGPHEPTYIDQPPTDALEATVQEQVAGQFTGSRPPFDDKQQWYCRSSLDLTMRGGTTSGVVYPNAICELARRFRLRNIGGASAGAIAAAAAAAAELGRARIRAGAQQLADLSEDANKSGRLRNGFAGLADLTAWVSEIDSPKSEQRIAQLFRPTPRALPIFRLVSAVMQPNYKLARTVILVLTAFGVKLRIFSGIAIGLVAALAFGRQLWGRPPGADSRMVPHGLSIVERYAAAWLILLGITIGLSALLSGVLSWVGYRSEKKQASGPAEDLAEPVLRRPPPSVPVAAALLSVLVLACAVAGVVLGATLALAAGVTIDWSWLILVWGVATTVQVAVHVGAIYKLVSQAKKAKYGMVAGATTREQLTANHGALWDRIAGLPKPTVEHALVPWLAQVMSDLAGPDAAGNTILVVRFGHLWKPDFVVTGEGVPSPAISLMRRNSRARSINLELMTSELVHGLPFKWPLSIDDQFDAQNDESLLYIRRSDMLDVFPADVLAALCPDGHHVTSDVRCINDGTDISTGHDLYPLPLPENLPVIFATRISLSFPALFQAVRMYRLVSSPKSPRHLVRDEFGARLQGTFGASKVNLSFPGPQVEGAVTTRWAEELWMTDGGVTSNFPVHLFDSVLPLWPTVGINLGGHPAGFAHQDVWLPSDDQARTSPPIPPSDSLLGFLGSLFNTARGWRDTYQTYMPAFRGRVAWVRQRKGEGGNNLYMDQKTIASLAVRGAVAGRRLRRRFESPAYWHRHQWLRLRIALDSLGGLHEGIHVAVRDPIYGAFAATPPANHTILDTIIGELELAGGDPDPASDASSPLEPSLPWFDDGIDDAYWSAAATLLDRYQEVLDTSGLHTGVPQPAPDLRQSPPI